MSIRNMMKYILTIFFCCVTLQLSAIHTNISVEFNGLNQTLPAQLISFNLGESKPFKEMRYTKNTFVFSGDLEAGLYGFSYGNIGFTFIVNEKEIKLKIEEQENRVSIYALFPEENTYWLSFLDKRTALYSGLAIIHPVVLQYDSASQLYTSAKKEFFKVQSAFNAYIETIPVHLLAYKYIMSVKKPDLKYNKRFEDQKKYLIQNWFNHFYWNELALLNSDIITYKIDEFLNLFYDKALGREAQEIRFREGIDIILNLSAQNNIIHEFVLFYLVKKLEEYNMESTIVYIAQKHMPQSEGCSNDSEEDSIIQRLKRYKKVCIGCMAPRFEIEDVNRGKVFNFDDLSDRNLIVFWRSDCYHCKQMLPYLDKWYQKHYKDWSLISISLDTDESELKNTIKENQLSFPVYSDFNGWKSKIALDYNVQSTPHFYLINKKGEIIDKPLSLLDLDYN